MAKIVTCAGYGSLSNQLTELTLFWMSMVAILFFFDSSGLFKLEIYINHFVEYPSSKQKCLFLVFVLRYLCCDLCRCAFVFISHKNVAPLACCIKRGFSCDFVTWTPPTRPHTHKLTSRAHDVINPNTEWNGLCPSAYIATLPWVSQCPFLWWKATTK